MKRRNKFVLWIALGIVAIVVLSIVVVGGGNSKMGNMFKLETAIVERGKVTNQVTATGTVEPVVKVDVGTQVSGIVSRIYVDFNDVVTKGQLIAEMDKVNLEAELVSKEADLMASKTQFEYQEKNYQRSLSLHGKNLISDTEFETATYNYHQAKSTYDRNRSDMTRVRRNLEYAIITSPIDGVVINRAVEQGQTVAAGFSTPKLFTIANDLTQMRVIAKVDEADIGQVEEGQMVTFFVDAFPNDIFNGQVTQVRLEATVTSNVVTYEVVISAPNPDLKLKPGLTANVTILTMERDNVLIVPQKAMKYIPDDRKLSALHIKVEQPADDRRKGAKTVWIKDGNTLKSKEVSTGTTSLSSVEITGGLSEGDEVVTELVVPNGGALPRREGGPFR